MKRIAYAALSLLIAFTALAADQPKSIDATYVATIGSIPDGVQKLTVWIPLPVSRGAQTVSDVKIESPYKWVRHVDKDFGNHYATTTIKNPKAGDLTVKVHFTATRREETMDHPFETSATKGDIHRALEANKLVTLSPRVRELADTITEGKTTRIEQAKAIYDYLVTNMTYDKVAPGWGHGDTERACDVKKGNCTDFHSLFISLARAKGIPARFVIGFPLTAADGQVKGYHCWAEFYVKGRGWIPVDASDGSKQTDVKARNYLFGNLDPARVQFTVGRDLQLSPRTNEPLNFFIYPHAEANGVEIGTPLITLQFTPR
ncbi:MAG TPA: transglutaminase domain-containing protein [Thermoanaerobaculia bacterium]|jgi:transglutaminase-like putative cysteine protease